MDGLTGLDGFSGEAREVRAARNQSLFRAVNEKLKATNEAFTEIADGSFAVACECADLECIEILQIPSEQYAEVRRDGSHFVVLAGHLYPDVERLVDQHDGYVVVEKTGLARELAERDAET
jgi:hypothetical protein